MGGGESGAQRQEASVCTCCLSRKRKSYYERVVLHRYNRFAAKSGYVAGLGVIMVQVSKNKEIILHYIASQLICDV